MVVSKTKAQKVASPMKGQQKSTPLAGKKRAMDDSEDEDFDDEEVDMETLKKLAKKIKSTDDDVSEEDEEMDSEDDEEDSGDEEDSEEEDADDNSEEDDVESEEQETAPVTKPSQNKKKVSTPAKANQVARPAPQVTEVNENCVMISNLENFVIPDNFFAFVASTSGVVDSKTFLSYKPTAFFVANNKQDALKIKNACQDVLFQGNQLQCSILKEGHVPTGKVNRLEDLRTATPTKSMVIYTLNGKLTEEQVQKVCPEAIFIHISTKSKVYVYFESPEICQKALLKLVSAKKIDNQPVMVKYMKNDMNTASFTGKETRIYLFNVPFKSTINDVKAIVPSAKFVHFNPIAPGSWVVEFNTPSDCKEASTKLNNHQMDGRPVRVSFVAQNNWDIRLLTSKFINNARAHFKKLMPKMVDFKTLSHNDSRGKRSPAFMLAFKNREDWLEAIEKCKSLREQRIEGAIVRIANDGSVPTENGFKKNAKPVKVQKVKDEESASEDDDEDADSAEEDDEPQAKKNKPNQRGGSQNNRGRGGKFGRGKMNRGRGK